MTGKTKTAKIAAADPDFIAKVVPLREEQELKWGDIATELSCTPGKAMQAYMIHTVKPKDRIKGTDEEISSAVVAARDEGASWGILIARTGLTEGALRNIYTEETGTDTRGLRVGKGGRPADGDAPAPAKKAAKKAPAKKGPAKKAAPKRAPVAKKGAAKKAPAKKKAAPKGKTPLTEMSQDELADRINGKTITVEAGGKKTKIPVDHVMKLDGDELTLADKAKKNRVILVSNIRGAGR